MVYIEKYPSKKEEKKLSEGNVKKENTPKSYSKCNQKMLNNKHFTPVFPALFYKLFAA